MANKKYVSLSKLSTFLDNLKDTFASLSHNHKLSDISDYTVDTALSSTSANPVQNKVIDAEFDAIADAMGALETAIDGKADSSHTHTIANVTNLQTTLDAKVPTSRTVNGKALTSNITLSASDVGADASGSANAVQENLDTHTSNADIHFTAAERTKLSGIAAGAQVNTVTGVKGNSESSYRTGNINITKANIGLGNVDNTADSAKSVNYATSAGSATKATQDGNGKVISSTYETKTDASAKLTEAKSYADTAATNAANAVKDDLLNGAGTAYDTLKELGDLIDDNADAIDALETVAAGKADKTHTHAISDVTNLQSALDGKAASSHGTHVSYSTTAPVMDGTASVGTASTVARSDHKHPTDTSRASKTEFDSHNSDTTKHITAAERTNWNAAYTHSTSAHAPSNAEKNQNAFSNITVGSTTVAADTTTDTVTFVGSNVAITPDATNDKITFAVADGTTSAKGVVQLTNSTSSTSTTTAATPSSVKSAYDLANTAKTNAATAQTRADSAYTLAEGKVDSLSDLDVTVTATELNYMDGVTSNVQAQLDAKMAKENPTGTGALSLNRKSSTTIGDYSVAEGYNATASGNYSHAEGYQTTALGEASHSGGYSNIVAGERVDGLTVDTSSEDIFAKWENSTLNFALAQKKGSFVHGTNCLALGENSFAVGEETVASGNKSFASGNQTRATGLYSTAMNTDTVASGYYAFATGNGTVASGTQSAAFGMDTSSEGVASVSMGRETVANNYQLVVGKYNVDTAAPSSQSDKTGSLFIVGNGTSDTSRSNAATVRADGNAWFAGDVYVGGSSYNDDESSRLISEADHKWTLIYDSGEISAIANSISGIDVSGYTNFAVLVCCNNDGDSHSTRAGSAIFTAQNGTTYQFPVWTGMFTKSISTIHAMAQFKLVDGWLVCPYASDLASMSLNIFSSTEGGTAGNLIPTGSGIMKCTSPLSTLTISSLDQNSSYYFGTGSRVMVWGWNA